MKLYSNIYVIKTVCDVQKKERKIALPFPTSELHFFDQFFDCLYAHRIEYLDGIFSNVYEV